MICGIVPLVQAVDGSIGYSLLDYHLAAARADNTQDILAC
jgi:hypothetical protein